MLLTCIVAALNFCFGNCLYGSSHIFARAFSLNGETIIVSILLCPFATPPS